MPRPTPESINHMMAEARTQALALTTEMLTKAKEVSALAKAVAQLPTLLPPAAMPSATTIAKTLDTEIALIERALPTAPPRLAIVAGE